VLRASNGRNGNESGTLSPSRIAPESRDLPPAANGAAEDKKAGQPARATPRRAEPRGDSADAAPPRPQRRRPAGTAKTPAASESPAASPVAGPEPEQDSPAADEPLLTADELRALLHDQPEA
jgi:hypothetical protein